MHPYSTKRALLAMICLGLLVASPLGAGEQLAIRVAPRMAFAPATLIVNAVAQPNAANRALRIELSSSEHYRSSLIQLEGDEAATTTTIRYEGVPAGTYEVSATLFGSGGEKRATTARTLEILSNTGR